MRGLAAAIALSLIAASAHARWPAGAPHTAEAAWFRSLNHNGVSCCAESDGHRLSPEFVRITKEGHYQFKATREAFGNAADEQWHDIPDDKLIRGKELAQFGGNPLGFWVVFTDIQWDINQHPTFRIYCAIPASGA